MKPAICTQCGASIEVDETRDAGICKYCGTPFVTEKVINNYITQSVNNVTENVTKIIYGKEKDEGSDFFRRALTLIDLEDWTSACDAMNKANKLSPEKAEYWFYSVVAQSKCFTSTKLFFHEGYDRSYGAEDIFEKAKRFFKLAKEDEKKELGKRFGFALNSLEEFIVDICERVGDGNRDGYVIDNLFNDIKWSEVNKDVLNRLCVISLKMNRGIGDVDRSLLDSKTREMLKEYNYRQSVQIDPNVKIKLARVRNYDAWADEDVIRLSLPSDVQTVDFPTGGSKGKRVVIPSTVKNIIGVRVGVPEFEIEGKGVALTAVMDIMRKCQPDVLYLPEGIVAPSPVNYNVVEFFPERLIVVCPETCEISVRYSFGYTRETTTLGGIFGGQIVYPKREKCSKEWLSHGLKAFNDNLRKYFGKEIKSGTITGFVEDGDLEGLYKRKGFFARLFGKK